LYSTSTERTKRTNLLTMHSLIAIFSSIYFILSPAWAISTDRIPACRQAETTYDNCLKSKLLANQINMYSIQALCTARCFPVNSPTPAPTAYDTCVINGINKCMTAQLSPNGIYLQGERPVQNDWDLSRFSSASSDCQTCIRSVVGQTMTENTMRTAQCLAFDECNPASGSSTTMDTCTTQSRQLYDAECVCKREQLSTIVRTCQQSSTGGQQRWNNQRFDQTSPISLCDAQESQSSAFRPLSCSNGSNGRGNNDNNRGQSGQWNNNGNWDHQRGNQRWN